MNDMVPKETLNKQAMLGVGGLAGGIVLGVLNGLAAAGGLLSIPGLIVGGIIAGTGFYLRSKKEKGAGAVTLGVGALTLAASLPIIGGLGSLLMSAGGLVLAGFGVLNLVKFFKGMKTRR